MNRRKIVAALVIPAIIVSLTGCGQQVELPESEIVDATLASEKIELSTEDIKDTPDVQITITEEVFHVAFYLEKGESRQLEVTTDYEGEILYSSSNQTVATIDEQGTVQAIEYGETTITVTCGTKIRTTKVLVKEQEATEETEDESTEATENTDSASSGGNSNDNSSQPATEQPATEQPTPEQPATEEVVYYYRDWNRIISTANARIAEHYGVPSNVDPNASSYDIIGFWDGMPNKWQGNETDDDVINWLVNNAISYYGEQERNSVGGYVIIEQGIVYDNVRDTEVKFCR